VTPVNQELVRQARDYREIGADWRLHPVDQRIAELALAHPEWQCAPRPYLQTEPGLATPQKVEERRERLHPLYLAALAKCRTNRAGKPHGGDTRYVESTYWCAIHGEEGHFYDHDLIYYRKRLAHFAEHGPRV
jgi:hypothetical protein